MKTIRILVLDDEPPVLQKLKSLYRDIFAGKGFDSVIVEEAATAQEAKQLARGAEKNPYDLVSLDVNLGDPVVTGLNVLGAFRRFESAWMAVLLTGVGADKTLDATLGKHEADKMRKQLRAQAYAQFPPERLIVVEKPQAREPETHARQLRDRLSDIASVYEMVARQRYVFRPIEVTALERIIGKKGDSRSTRKFVKTRSLHWQVRFNCGDMRTLPDRAGYKVIHKLLSLDRTQSLTPEEARAIEPPEDKPGASTAGEDTVAAFFTARGVAWDSLTDAERDKMIHAALAFRFRRYVALRTLQDEDELTEAEADELDAIRKEIGPLADVAEEGYQRIRPADVAAPISASGHQVNPAEEALASGDLHVGGGDYQKSPGSRGFDSTAAKGFRGRKRMVIKYLRENGFADMAQHLEDYIQPNRSNWSYNPPGDIEWTTT